MNKPIIFLICLLTGIFLFMLPLQEQAFRDDFAYAWSAKHFVETGHLRISEWSSAADITPTWWGGLWVKIFGFSFSALHAANFFIFSLGIIAFFFLLRQFYIPSNISVIFTLILLSNPWMINFAMSYMTDIQAMSFTIISILFLFLGMKRNNIKLIVLGSIFMGLSFLTRQIALSFLVGMIVLFALHLKQRNGAPRLKPWCPKIPSLPTPPKQPLRLRKPDAKASEGYPPHYMEAASAEASFRIHPPRLTGWFSAKADKKWATMDLAAILPLLLVILGYFYWLGKDYHKTLAQYYTIDGLTYQKIYKHLFTFSFNNFHDSLNAWKLIGNRGMSLLSQMIVFSLPVWIIYAKHIAKIIVSRKNIQLFAKSLVFLVGIYALDVSLNYDGYTAGYPIGAFEVVPIWPWFWPHLWKYFLAIGIFFWASIPVLFRFQKQKLFTPVSLFLGIPLSGYLWLSSTLVWTLPQYGIQFFPFILLFFARLTKGIKFNVLFSVSVVAIILFYSAVLARFRYQLGGQVWNACEQLRLNGYLPSQIECNGQYAHRYWHELEPIMAQRVAAVGREEFIKTNDGVWSDYLGIERKIQVTVIYDDSLFSRWPNITIKKI